MAIYITTPEQAIEYLLKLHKLVNETSRYVYVDYIYIHDYRDGLTYTRELVYSHFFLSLSLLHLLFHFARFFLISFYFISAPCHSSVYTLLPT